MAAMAMKRMNSEVGNVGIKIKIHASCPYDNHGWEKDLKQNCDAMPLHQGASFTPGVENHMLVPHVSVMIPVCLALAAGQIIHCHGISSAF